MREFLKEKMAKFGDTLLNCVLPPDASALEAITKIAIFWILPCLATAAIIMTSAFKGWGDRWVLTTAYSGIGWALIAPLAWRFIKETVRKITKKFFVLLF